MHEEIIEGGITIGQSNAGWVDGEPGGPLIKTFGPESRLLMLMGKAGGSIGSETPDTFDPALVPYQDPMGRGQSPAAMLAYAAQKLDDHFGVAPRSIAIHSSFRGNISLDEFFPGRPFHLHENAVAAQAAFVAATESRKSRYDLRWIDFIQGEGGPYLAYDKLLNDYIDLVLPRFSRRDTATPPFLVSQVNAFTYAESGNPVALAQLAVSRLRYGSGVHLTGPMYQCPFHDPGHLTDNGRMIHGECRALARHYAVNERASWNPLWPSRQVVERRGRVLIVPMRLPPGCTTLSFDDDWVPFVRDKGFIYKDGPYARLDIESVEIDEDRVLVRLSAEPEAQDGVLEYATCNQEPVEWWAGGRGLLYSDSLVPSPYAALGYEVPQSIRNYCVTFALPVVEASSGI